MPAPTLFLDFLNHPPFKPFLLKIHSRCNLACGYCYMHEHAY